MRQRDVNARPVDLAEFTLWMSQLGPFPPGARLAVAVSGGPDSLALMALASAWCAAEGLDPPRALIVDHRLRAESSGEAVEVQRQLRKRGWQTELLIWEHGAVKSRMHERARAARYDLLVDACRRRKLTHLVLAHHRDDQAETILMRFAKGTGVDGLAGMPVKAVRQGVVVMRPLLAAAKARLLATCEAQALRYVEDPSNRAPQFARGRLRQAKASLAREGLSVERLIDLGERAAEASAALAYYTHDFLMKYSNRDAFGIVTIDREALCAQPRAISLRALALVLQEVHPQTYAPTRAALVSLLEGVGADGVLRARTLHGCLVGVRKKTVVFCREPSAIPDRVALSTGKIIIWDQRWRIDLSAAAKSGLYEVGKLGTPTHAVLDHIVPGLRHKLPQGRLRAGLPALWRNGELVGLGDSGKNANFTARLIFDWPPPLSFPDEN